MLTTLMSLYADVLCEQCLKATYELRMVYKLGGSLLERHLVLWKRYTNMAKRLNLAALYLNRITGTEEYFQQFWTYQGKRLPYMSVLELSQLLWLSEVLVGFRIADWRFHETIQEMRQSATAPSDQCEQLRAIVVGFADADLVAEKSNESGRYQSMIAQPYLSSLSSFCKKFVAQKFSSFSDYLLKLEQLVRFQEDLIDRVFTGISENSYIECLGKDLGATSRRALSQQVIKSSKSKYTHEFPTLVQTDNLTAAKAMFSQLQFAGSALGEDLLSSFAPVFEKLLLDSGLKTLNTTTDYMSSLFGLLSRLSSFATTVFHSAPPVFEKTVNSVAKQFVNHHNDKSKLGLRFAKFMDQLLTESRQDAARLINETVTLHSYAHSYV